ncbi:MAG: hypothetical protein ACUVRL_05985 [Candidatus Saccharicenans sp.]|uniref:hypothetical protein n=1 Tax=Candidatus Saccharicenans sp. TaxID=2819258 RepID=UPI0040491B44
MRKVSLLVLMLAVATNSLLADPVLTRPETVANRIIIYPDHKNPKLFYYVPTELRLSQSFGQPNFFFYKYVYVKDQGQEGLRTTAGGVLTLSVEFGDESEFLRKEKGTQFEFRPVPIETMEISLSYTGLEGEKKEEEAPTNSRALASNRILWTGKSFTFPLSRESASYLWKIYEEKKAAGLSVEGSFSYGGYEMNDEGQLQPGERSGRLSLDVPVSMEQNPELFKVINLAQKFSFNYRKMSVICFDFVNGLNKEVVKMTVEVESTTARGQKDVKSVVFSAETQPQYDLEFNIPEAKGGKYRYRITRILADGRSVRGDWQEGDNAFLDLSSYDLVIKDN